MCSSSHCPQELLRDRIGLALPGHRQTRHQATAARAQHVFSPAQGHRKSKDTSPKTNRSTRAKDKGTKAESLSESSFHDQTADAVATLPRVLTVDTLVYQASFVLDRCLSTFKRVGLQQELGDQAASGVPSAVLQAALSCLVVSAHIVPASALPPFFEKT